MDPMGRYMCRQRVDGSDGALYMEATSGWIRWGAICGGEEWMDPMGRYMWRQRVDGSDGALYV